MSSTTKIDPRVARSRAALVGAFNRLLLARGYDAIGPATIASAAGVARSTFYEHFAGKAALFRHALQPVLAPLAEAAARSPTSGANAMSLDGVLAHFWENRRLARVVLSGRPRVVMASRLAELVEARLTEDRRVAIVPLPVVAHHVAHGQLAIVEAWLTGRHRCDASTIARAIAASTAAAVDALAEDPWSPRRTERPTGLQRVQGAASSVASP